MITKSISIFTTAVLSLGFAASGAADETPESAGVSKPQTINPEFATELYAQLCDTEGNVFFSPYSITESMAMVHAGAGGNTATEIAKALSMDGDQQTITQRLQAQRTQLMAVANKGDNQLNIANALCVRGEVPKQSYQTLVREQFAGELFSGALPEINGWVKEKTEGNIEKILERLDSNSACVLLNAVYFKGTWKHAFSRSDTHDRDFYVAANKSVKVPMMSREGQYALARNDKYIAVELPYKSSCSMVLIMPTKAEDFEQFEAGFNHALTRQICTELKGAQREIDLYVPKFKIEAECDLIAPMKKLGLVKALDGGEADFSAMYDLTKLKSGDNIYISQIQHKATLEVDEKGSVATAATATGFAWYSASSSQPVKICFDRPFLVLIRENTTNTTLFAGRISDPSK